MSARLIRASGAAVGSLGRGRPSSSAVLALALLMVSLLVACAPRGRERPPAEVDAVVLALEAAIASGDYAGAHRLVDYDYRLEEVLGDLWSAGDAEARAELVEVTRGMFEDTTERLRERFAGRTMEHYLAKREGPHLWVESHPRGETRTFAWRYRLTRRGDAWSITQREYTVSGMPSDSTRFWPMARKRIASRFGRDVTLKELTANLPSVMGTMRARAIRIPDLGSRPRATP